MRRILGCLKCVVLLVGRLQEIDSEEAAKPHFGLGNLEPTAGFEPATRCLQIRQQLNSARNFGFPCIRNASIWSQVFLRVGYRIGYRKPSPKSARAVTCRALLGFVSTFIGKIAPYQPTWQARPYSFVPNHHQPLATAWASKWASM